MWLWVAVGLGSFAVVALLIGLVLARVLGTIAREVSEIHEHQFWSSWETPRQGTEPGATSPDSEPARPRIPAQIGEGTNIDFLAWFDEDERQECPACGQRARVTLQDALATFCLACGRIWTDGASIELTPERDVVAHTNDTPTPE